MTLPKALLATHAGQAAVTQAWIDGIGQKRLAQVFGYEGPATINLVIERFVTKFYDDCPGRIRRGRKFLPQGAERLTLAAIAVARYRQEVRCAASRS